MLLDINREVSTNIKGATAFSVTEDSAKLFAMLGTMLYKDKERSCLTELSSNALDAHAMVGKQHEPIHVTMPTTLCPEITVRDFGPGLSEENVIKFLTTYGKSSKQQDAGAIGGYGIGSKSPASVTDTWNIHSYHNGIHTQYLVYVSSEGVPALTKIISKPTTETGVAVVIPVKADRLHAWKNAAQATYAAYHVMPVIHNIGTPIHKIKWIIETDVFNLTNDNRINVYVDHRLYEVDRSKITESTTDAIVKFMCNIPNITLKFISSDISKSLSREELQFDKKTITAIQNKLIDSYKLMNEMWKNDVVEKAENELQFLVIGSKWLDTMFPSSYGDVFKRNAYISFSKGAKYYSDKHCYGARSIVFESDELDEPRYFAKHGLRVKKYFGNRNSNSFFGYNYNSITKKSTISLVLSELDNILFVEDDGVSMINLRIKEAYSCKSNVIIMKSFNFIPDFLKSKIVKSSTLPKPVVVRAPRAPRIKTDFYAKNGRYFHKVEEDVFKNQSNVAYIRFTNATTVTSILPEFKEYIDTLDSFNIDFVAIKENTEIPSWANHPKDVLKKVYDDKFKNFENIFKALFVNEVKSNKYVGSLLRKGIKTPSASYWNTVSDMIQSIMIDTTNPMLNKSVVQLDREVNNIITLARVLNIPVPASITTYNYEAIEDKIIKTYPMLKFAKSTYETLTDIANSGIIMEYVGSVGV